MTDQRVYAETIGPDDGASIAEFMDSIIYFANDIRWNANTDEEIEEALGSISDDLERAQKIMTERYLEANQ